jgi:hypothetical protein
MKKSLAWLALFCVVVFAQADPCKAETQKAESLNDICAKFDAQSQSYIECIKLYIEQKVKVSEACKAASPEPVPAPVSVPAPEPAPAVIPVVPPALPVVVPAPVAVQPVPSLAQALRVSGLSEVCVGDFESVLGRGGFSMGKFVKELPPVVAKVKVQMKSPFGKPKDGDVTSVGLTVGCIKALPESPAEIQSLLKNISLKAGLDLAMDAAASAAEDYISTNIAKEGGSEGGTFKNIIRGTLLGIAVASTGIAIYQNAVAGEKRDKIGGILDDAAVEFKTGNKEDYNDLKKSYETSKEDLRRAESMRNGFYISAGLFGVAGVASFFF